MLVVVQLYLNIQRLGQVVGEREVEVATVWEKQVRASRTRCRTVYVVLLTLLFYS